MFKCNRCGQDTPKLSWLREKDGWCSECFHISDTPLGQSSMIATDSIPGGYEVRHALCWPDGTPRRFDSKSDIKRAAFEAGYTIGGDTPKVNQRIREERLAKEGR